MDQRSHILAGLKFARTYTEADVKIGTIIRRIRSAQSINISSNPDVVIQTLSSNYYSCSITFTLLLRVFTKYIKA